MNGCKCVVLGAFSWNRECPLHGVEPGKVEDARVERIESLLNEFNWSATVPKHRLKEILDGNV